MIVTRIFWLRIFLLPCFIYTREQLPMNWTTSRISNFTTHLFIYKCNEWEWYSTVNGCKFNMHILLKTECTMLRSYLMKLMSNQYIRGHLIQSLPYMSECIVFVFIKLYMNYKFSHFHNLLYWFFFNLFVHCIELVSSRIL